MSFYSLLSLQKHRVCVKGHQNNLQTSKIISCRDCAPSTEIPGSATDFLKKYCNFCPFYCKESTEWFAGLHNVKPEGIGMIGISKGGMYTLELCRHVPKASTLVDVHEV